MNEPLPLPEVRYIPPSNEWQLRLQEQIDSSNQAGKVWPQEPCEHKKFSDIEYRP